MLYIVNPDRQMQWTANVGQDVLDFANANQKELADFDWWEPAEGVADDVVVQVALRYGIPSKAGIIVDAGHVVLVRRPNELRATFRETEITLAKAAPQIEAVDKYIDENISPGWLKAGHELDERVQASLARSLEEAERDAREELDRRKPQSDLITHWVSMGGSLPQPI